MQVIVHRQQSRLALVYEYWPLTEWMYTYTTQKDGTGEIHRLADVIMHVTSLTILAASFRLSQVKIFISDCAIKALASSTFVPKKL